VNSNEQAPSFLKQKSSFNYMPLFLVMQAKEEAAPE
jgi:hypothetical protein